MLRTPGSLPDLDNCILTLMVSNGWQHSYAGSEHPPMEQTRQTYSFCHSSGSTRNDVRRKAHRLLVFGSHRGGRGLRSNDKCGVASIQATRGFTWPARRERILSKRWAALRCKRTDVWFNSIVPCALVATGDCPPGEFSWLVQSQSQSFVVSLEWQT